MHALLRIKHPHCRHSTHMYIHLVFCSQTDSVHMVPSSAALAAIKQAQYRGKTITFWWECRILQIARRFRIGRTETSSFKVISTRWFHARAYSAYVVCVRNPPGPRYAYNGIFKWRAIIVSAGGDGGGGGAGMATGLIKCVCVCVLEYGVLDVCSRVRAR